MEKDQYKKLIKSIAAAYQDATEQFIGDSTDLLELASKTKSGVMQTQISVDDMNQYYADALLDCLKNSNNLINGIAKKFFKGNYKEALAALTEIINNKSAATKAKLKSYGLENDEQVKVDFLTVNYVTQYLKPLVTGKDLINLISQKDGVRTRATVALAALKNISNLYFKSPADMSGLKRSIVDLDKISKMKSESMKITKTKTLLEQAKEILFSEASQETAYLKKLKKLNPGWDPEKAKTDFENEYDEDDPEDISNHVDYEENAAEWLDNISSFTPGVKVGDWVEAYVKNAPGDSKICIGKIVKETTMEGHDYGWMGYKGPKKIPAWDVQVFAKDQYGDYKSGEPNDYVIYDNIVYMNIGKVTYIQHDEIQSNKKVEKYKTYTKQNTFKRLPKQNLVVKTIK